MKALKGLMCVALALVISTGALAADEAKKGKGEAKKGKRPAPSVTARFLEGIELTAEQKEKVAAIDKEFAAKAAEIKKKGDAILTEDQIKARAEAQKAARAAGSKGPDAQKAVNAALKLSDEQKTKMAEVQKANRELSGEVVAALKKVLTEEQSAKLKAPAARGNAKKGDAKKPAAKGKKKPESK